MALPILPYTVDHYNSVPELEVAANQFKSTPALETLFTELGKTLVKHRVESTLGEAHEILVNVDSAAVPWDTRSGTKELESVNASAWRFTEEGLAPYEFTHAAPEMHLDYEPMQSFSLEFGAILAKWNLANVLGVCSLKEKPIDRAATIEFTSGRANITLPFDIAPDDGSIVDAMWQFSSDNSDSSSCAGQKYDGPEHNYFPKFIGQCKNRCKGKPHEKRHMINT